MYDALRSEYEALKKGGIVPVHKPRGMAPNPYNSGGHRQGGHFATSGFDDPPRGAADSEGRMAPCTPSHSADVWYVRPSLSSSGLFEGSMPVQRGRADIPSPATSGGGFLPRGKLSRSPDTNAMFAPAGGDASNALRNLLLSPMRRPANRIRSGLSR
eukprot:TRINITY_DN3325_c0_g1_i4.p1 TRINITY_DN3325_c0_g1~~TRINITY_DN3325_c0_g1_i4.p1  ORF type:complete len:157 (+),score=13.98 TRINITY_DN3325_c0_g1_i4:392-862(+)